MMIIYKDETSRSGSFASFAEVGASTPLRAPTPHVVEGRPRLERFDSVGNFHFDHPETADHRDMAAYRNPTWADTSLLDMVARGARRLPRVPWCTRLYIYIYVHVYISLSIYLSIYLSFYISLSLYIYAYMYTSLSLSISLSLYIYIYTSISLSLSLSLCVYIYI